MSNLCGYSGGQNFYCDLDASAGGDGLSPASAWNDIDEAISNISSYNKNMSATMYLNIKSNSSNYVLHKNISYLSDFVMRNYSSSNNGVIDATHPWIPETGSPVLEFDDDIICTHMDNSGINHIDIISGNTGNIKKFEIRYSYIQMVDVNITAQVYLYSTRVNINTDTHTATTIRSDVGPSAPTTISIKKGSVLIITDHWELYGNDTQTSEKPVWNDGGVLISGRISNYTTNPEPVTSEFNIGYYGTTSINILSPSDPDQGHPTTSPATVLALSDKNTGSDLPTAGWFPANCVGLGCVQKPIITQKYINNNSTSGDLVGGGAFRLKANFIKVEWWDSIDYYFVVRGMSALSFGNEYHIRWTDTGVLNEYKPDPVGISVQFYNGNDWGFNTNILSNINLFWTNQTVPGIPAGEWHWKVSLYNPNGSSIYGTNPPLTINVKGTFSASNYPNDDDIQPTQPILYKTVTKSSTGG